MMSRKSWFLVVAGLVIGACSGSGSSPTTGAPVDTPLQGACGFTVAQNQASQTIGAAGGSLTIPVTATAGCNWTARSDAGFLSIADAGSGNGSGSVVVAVALNTGAERTGTLVIAGVTFTIKQDAAACAFALGGDTNRVFAVGGGSGRITVTVTQGPANCSWTAASNASFIAITAGASGTGAGNVDFTVAANSGNGRNGTLTIAGQTVTVGQAGVGTTTTTQNSTTTTVPGTTTVATTTAGTTTVASSTTTSSSTSTTTTTVTTTSTTTTSGSTTTQTTTSIFGQRGGSGRR